MKQRVVIQWVTRTRAECREATAVVGVAEAALGMQTESPIRAWYHGPLPDAGHSVLRVYQPRQIEFRSTAAW